VTGEWTAELEHWIGERAVEVGFDAAGIAPVTAPESQESMLDAERFAAWVAAGRAGEMEYLKRRDDRGVLLRSGVQVAMPWARSVIVCALNYNAGGPHSIEGAANDAGWIARYAWSGNTAATGFDDLIPTDYHDELLQRLRRVESALKQRLACETRCYVDTGPLVERTAAAKAGVGWIGKNTCVINQGLGSWLLLGVIVTSLPVQANAALNEAEDRCGSCTRCIDACPTDALVAPYQLDSNRCISYLTIEKRGEMPDDMRKGIGRHVFGCDICQDVCPWNRKAPATGAAEFQPRANLVNPALAWLAEISTEEFREKFRGSAIRRTKRSGLRRNAVIAMGNSGNRRFVALLQKLSSDEDPVVAESARWAVEKLCVEE